MGSIGWDIVRTTLGALLLILLSRTALVWLATALRETDLITRQGETVIAIAAVLAFIGMPLLVMAQRVLVIAPIAMVLAAAHVRNDLASACAAVTERLTRRFATI
jgi:lipopolysaccharide export system permease protein